MTKDIDYEKTTEKVYDGKVLAVKLNDAKNKLDIFLLETKSPNQLKKKWNAEGANKLQLYQQIPETKVKKKRRLLQDMYIKY